LHPISRRRAPAISAVLLALVLGSAAAPAVAQAPALPSLSGGGLTGDNGGGGDGGGGGSTAPGGGTGAKGPGGRCTPSIDGPNDPDYANAERTGQGSFNSEQWYLFDCLPLSAPAAADPEEAGGMSVNRAWREFGRGSKEVVVAYMEGGVNWRRPSAKDLRHQAFLNAGELPTPSCGKDDCDGDGVFTADDFKADPRIHKPLLHAATAGGITPEDLIVAFSDGRDDDGNGYRDDISGWNFHRDTNDPQIDQSIYEHANGEQRVLAGQADNGVFGTGLCPNCRLLSVKLGDEAIDRPDRIAKGIVFAVDSGAKVLCLVVASLGQSAEVQQAIDYAHDQGVVVVWASNDFESADHQDGMRFARVWPGNGVVADQTNRGSRAQPNDAATTTFRARSSVTSYGPHSLFSVSSSNGSTSQSTPIQAGVAAMVHSAGLQFGRPLDADEVRQVVRSTSSFIGRLPCPTCFQGADDGREFNIQYGYGRPNVYRAMLAVRDGAIPPTADIRTPDWYREVDPTRQGAVEVRAAVAAKHSAGYRWELQYAPGPEPRDGEFRTFAGGAGSTPATAAGRLDLSQIPASFWSGAYRAPTADRLSIERYDVTLRVRVVDAAGRVGLDRRVIAVRHDDDEVQALHVDLGSSAEASPALADLEGRGELDVVVATSQGTVHALRPDGSRVPGWPVHTDRARGLVPGTEGNYLGSAGWRSRRIGLPDEPVASPPAVGDLDHDGGLDVVVTGLDGGLYVWDAKGRPRKGFPTSTDRRFAGQSVPVPDTPYKRNASTGSFGGAALADLDGDRDLEIVMGGWDGRVYAWRPDGSALPGWPVSTEIPEGSRKPPGTQTYARDDKVATTPTIVDVDGDRRPDVVVALQDTAFGPNGSPVFGFVSAFSSKGTQRAGGALLPGYPVALPAAAQGYGTAQDFITEGVQTPVAYLQDGKPKLVANPGLFGSQTVDLATRGMTPEQLSTLPAEGPVNPASPLVHFSASPMVGRIGGRPQITAVQGASAITDIVTAIATMPGLGARARSAQTAWDPETGRGLAQMVRPLQGLAFIAAPALADVSGDGKADTIIPTDSAAIHAFDGVTGEPVPGWPKWTGGWTLWTPAVGDLDGDGRVEVVASLREGVLRAWRTPGRAEANGEAWHWHQNDRNTGLYGEDTRPPAAVRNLRVKREAGRSVVSFRASGDDWNAGRAERFVVYRSTRAIGDDLSRATRVAVVDAAPAGQTQTVVVPRPRSKVARPFHFAVRGVDDADNIGPLPGAAGAPCLSRRTFTIRLPRIRGGRVLRATVRIGTRRVPVRRRGSRLTARIDLRGRPPGTVRVRITQRVRTAAGRSIARRSTRSYRLCRTTRKG